MDYSIKIGEGEFLFSIKYGILREKIPLFRKQKVPLSSPLFNGFLVHHM